MSAFFSTHTNTHVLRWKGSRYAGGGRPEAVVDFVLRQHAGWMIETLFGTSALLIIRRSALSRLRFMAAGEQTGEASSDTLMYMSQIRFLGGHWLFSDTGKFCCLLVPSGILFYPCDLFISVLNRKEPVLMLNNNMPDLHFFTYRYTLKDKFAPLFLTNGFQAHSS